jgi:acyl carrier protein
VPLNKRGSNSTHNSLPESGFTVKSEKSSKNAKLGRLLSIREGETSMKQEEITGKLKSVFQKVLEEKDITITREMTAQDIEKWDSLRHIQLISEVESTFGIKFKLREILSMNNVGDLIDLIIGKQGARLT